MISIRRMLSGLGLAVAAVGLAACSGAVSQQDVASAISGKLTEQGVNATGVTCPADLPAEVGKSVRCEYTVDGKPVGVTATVSSVQGDQAHFDIVSEAPLVARENVAAAIDEQLTAQGVATDGATACPGALIGEMGRSVRCEYVVGGQPVDAIATVSSVTGDQANFDISVEARPVAKDLLDSLIAEHVQQELQVPIDGADCGGDLQPTAGESVTCTVTSGAESLDVLVTVTGVDAIGLVEYSLEAV